MKHFRTQASLHALIVGFILSYLIIAPVYSDLVAQSFDSTPPVISHRTVKMAKRGKPLNIIAHIGDDSSVDVVLSLEFNGEKIDGKLPEIKTSSSVPVKVRIAVTQADIFSRPGGSSARKRATVNEGEIFSVTSAKNGYYRVHNDDDLYGYIPMQATTPIVLGKRYGTAIPPAMTQYETLSYQITATDAYNNISKTDFVTVRLLTEQQIADMQAGKAPSSATTAVQTKSSAASKSSPFYKKIWFWVLVAATAGGVYYITTKEDESSKNATVNVDVEWQ